MTQHTPGPWKLNKSPMGATFVMSTEGWVAELSILNSEANARLIAASPEMLECLRRIFDLADESAKGIDGYEQIAEWSRNLLAKVGEQE